MDAEKIKPFETRVQIVKRFEENATSCMFIIEECLQKRTPDVVGVVCRWVSGHGGDVWWVAHSVSEDEKNYTNVAPYLTNEFDIFVETEETKGAAELDNVQFLRTYGKPEAKPA
jgi:hypothetical protein